MDLPEPPASETRMGDRVCRESCLPSCGPHPARRELKQLNLWGEHRRRYNDTVGEERGERRPADALARELLGRVLGGWLGILSGFARVVDGIFWELSPKFCGSCVAGVARELHWSCAGRVQELLDSCKGAALISHCWSCSEVAPELLRSYLEVALLELPSWSCVAGVAREFH